MKSHYIFSFFWFVLSINLWSERFYSPAFVDPILESWRWKSIYELDKLNIQNIEVSPNGDVWLDSPGGLVQYDGLDFKNHLFDEEIYEKVNTELKNLRARFLIFLEDGTPLFFLNQFVVALKSNQWQVVLKFDESYGNRRGLLKDKDGSVWILYQNVLFHLDSELSHYKKVYENKVQESFRTMCQDQNSNLWITQSSTKSKLIKIPLNENRALDHDQLDEYVIPQNDIIASSKLNVGLDGKIWLAEYVKRRGIKAFDPKLKRWEDPIDIHKDRIYNHFIDSEGIIWLSCKDSLVKLEKDNKKEYSLKDLLVNSHISGIVKDHRNTLWLSEKDGRVKTIDMNFERQVTYKNLNFQGVRNKDEHWFINDKQSLVMSHKGEWKVLDARDVDFKSVLKTFISSQDTLWVIGKNKSGENSLYSFTGSVWQKHDLPTGVRFGQEINFHEGQKHELWITGNDLALGKESRVVLAECQIVDRSSIRSVKLHQTPFSKNVKLAQTADGRLYIGSDRVYHFDRQEGKFLALEDLPKLFVNDICSTDDGSLWVALRGNGLYRRYQNEWSQYLKEDGLISQQITKLCALDGSEILAASELGVSRYDGKSWTTSVYPDSYKFSLEGGGIKQGLKSEVWLNFNASNLVARVITYNSSYSTIRINKTDSPPETHLLYAPNEVKHSENVHFSWGGKDVWGDTPQNKLQYSWRLNQGTWSDFSTQSQLILSDVKIGSNFFEVRARDLEFNVDLSPASTYFQVTPPIWRQLWFQLLILSLLGTIVWLVWVLIKAREKHLLDRQADRDRHWKEVDQMKMAFFTNISHELRTPLSVILGPLQKLEVQENDPSKNKLVKMVSRNAERMSTLIDQLLDFRKIEDGNLKMEWTEGNIGQHLINITMRLYPVAEDKSCELKCEGDCYGWFDSDKLDKIVTNLTYNAIKYAPEQSAVIVRLKKENNSEMRIVIEDNGMGIPPDYLDKIFDRFYRVPIDEIINGSGIGLNLTKELIDLWNGSISVESPIYKSKERPGTRFTIMLPIVNPEQIPVSHDNTTKLSEELKQEDPYFEEPETLSHSTGPNHAKSVLIVEDEIDLNEFLKNELSEKYSITTAVNGEKGLDLAREIMPDLIVTDWMMPGMSGDKLCSSLKSDFSTSHIPIIMLTAKTSLESQLKGLDTGADDYITKPFQIKLLEKRIENLLKSREQLKEKYKLHLITPEAMKSESSIDRDFMLKVTEVLEKGVSDSNFDVESLAAALHMSNSTLRRKLKALADTTPSKLIWDMRLKLGQELLSNSSLKIVQIALEVGFADSTHFGKLFKKEYGVSPKEYRDKSRTSD